MIAQNSTGNLSSIDTKEKKSDVLVRLQEELHFTRIGKEDIEDQFQKIKEENEELRKCLEIKEERNKALFSQLLDIKTKVNECDGNFSRI